MSIAAPTAPVAPAEIRDFTGVLQKIRDVNVAPDVVRAAIADAVVDVRGKLKGIPELDRVLIDQSLLIRDETLDGIDGRLDRYRLLASAEIALLRTGLAQEGSPDADGAAMHAAVDTFRTAREQRRRTLTAALGTVADEIIGLQGTLEHAYERGAIVTMSQAADATDAFNRLCLLISETAGKPDVCDPQLLRKYLIEGDAAALAAIEAALAADTFREAIMDLLREARPMFEEMSRSGPSRFLRIGRVMMKAATATKVDGLPAHGWYDKAVERAIAQKGATLDLNTNTGVRFVIYVDDSGAKKVLMKDAPKQYGDPLTDDQVEAILRGEQNEDDRQTPNSAPIYVHLYEENEVQDAFAAMPPGARCSCKVSTPDGWKDAKLVKGADTFEYETPVDGAPPAADVYANPGLNMLPWSLRFILNGTNGVAATV